MFPEKISQSLQKMAIGMHVLVIIKELFDIQDYNFGILIIKLCGEGETLLEVIQ
jgi:hypothetical protein